MIIFDLVFGFHDRLVLSDNSELCSFKDQRYFHFEVNSTWSGYELVIISGGNLFENFDSHI